ncbi:MAG TPA: hypothetical protein VF423_06670 [Actinomycetes bacterium]
MKWAVLRAVDESAVTPGVLGFLVVALLGVATYLLIRSMNRQIRRIDVPDDHDRDDDHDHGKRDAGGPPDANHAPGEPGR